MISFKQAKHLVEDITYKPGWSFNLYDHCSSCGSAQLVMGFTAPDATGREDGLIPIKAAYIIDLHAVPTPMGLARHILQRVHSVEHHETLEFFKVGGHNVYDPHHQEGSNESTTA